MTLKRMVCMKHKNCEALNLSEFASKMRLIETYLLFYRTRSEDVLDFARFACADVLALVP